jgi:cell division transport system permease protein
MGEGVSAPCPGALGESGVVSFLVGEAVKDLRRAGRVGVSAVLLIALSLAALGGFWLLSSNLERAVDQWRERVRVIAYLKEEPSAATRDELLRRIEAVGGIERLRYVSKSEAMLSLRRSLGPQADVAEALPRNPLPASVELTPDAATATPEATRALVDRVAALPEVDDVQGGAQWVEGLAHFQSLFRIVGLSVGAVLALASVLTVTTATTVVLYLRREEVEIMRLVGASEMAIRLPRALQGIAQGLVAGTIALAALEALYALAAPWLDALLPLTLGLERVVFLSPAQMLALIAVGAGLGGVGGLLAKRSGP